MKRNYHAAFSSVVNYINVPPILYRYEDRAFIDKFFETGEIFISCFRLYASYPDNQLGDKTEGNTINFGRTANNMTLVTVTGVGQNSYCLCTSTIFDETLKETFKRNDVFRINDPINFMLEIEKSLSRVREVLFGNCIYLERKSVVKDVPAFDMDSLSSNDGTKNIAMDKLMTAMAPLNGPEQFFVKNSLYQRQSEFRLIFTTDRAVSEGTIIYVPEARQYCERIDAPTANSALPASPDRGRIE